MTKDFIFEISWEIANKVGGIYTVLTTKAAAMVEKYGDNYILIGPDLVREGENQDFIEDRNLHAEWKDEFERSGIKVRCGRWNIPSSPRVMLIDFTTLFGEKDKIFTVLWDKFGLDSLTGQWDYIEPAIFGYAAGKLIHSFHDFHNDKNRTVGHFHEWMTGAGILYLKNNAPYIGTVFTTHATILGRTIAGNNLPLYSMLKSLQPVAEARKFNIRAKYSMERVCAATADVFATVSEVTSEECRYVLGKQADMVAPNGFNNDFVPQGDDFLQSKRQSRETIFKGLESVLGYRPSDDAFLILNSGRYEFHNKGIDVFIEAVAGLRKQNPSREVVAVIAVPAAAGDIAAVVKQRLAGDFSNPEPAVVTHNLFDIANDPVVNAIKSKGIENEKNSKVKIVFVPVYLNGNDGLFNTGYYEFLHGFDMTVFPSYYEPWGYTPMESVAFGIPTVTTTLAGFGRWILPAAGKGNRGAVVIERNDENRDEVVNAITTAIEEYMQAGTAEKAADDAFALAASVEWKNLIDRYFALYARVGEMIDKRIDSIDEKMFHLSGRKFTGRKISQPRWNKAFVEPSLPDSLKPLMELSKNLWWTWNTDAAMLFKAVNSSKWVRYDYNPIALLESLTLDEIENLERNKDFMRNLAAVYEKFRRYMDEKPSDDLPQIAYFSMEFGIHDTVKIFSGGLGILAGDYLKEISDRNINLTGVGLLYRYGYFKQTITLSGDQIAESKPQKFTHLPVLPVRDSSGRWLIVEIGLPGRKLSARVWMLPVGRVKLYLLDTDIDENNDDDRKLTAHLYGGGHETRLLQEILLGVGGVRALEMAGELPVLYHLNEGHAAMAGLERIRKIIFDRGMSFDEAMEVVRSSSLFTTHTPVPAGHDKFSEDLIRRYLPHYADRLGISWEEFMALGREDRFNYDEEFSMSVLAARLSQEMNGVSALHGEVSRKMFASMYPGYFPEELHIGHVTNGVHWPTWTSKRWQMFFNEVAGCDFVDNQGDISLWQKIADVGDKKIWELRNYHRAKLTDYLKRRLERQLTEMREEPRTMLRQINGLSDKVLTIGFARRFATYKRALLLFSNLQRLEKIVNNKDYPVQFVFAGKAHPADKAGQDLIKRIVEISRMPQFTGKIFFVADYDISLAKKLVQGVDVWLNNPTRPLEASGTSGEKAVMNGVLNLSVLDGWWAEGYVEGAGWALEEQRTFDDQNLQDQLDAANIYRLLETEVVPVFYRRNRQGIPEEWTAMIKRNFAEIAPHFTMTRMVDDYVNLFYAPLAERAGELAAPGSTLPREISQWKSHIRSSWSKVETLKIDFPDTSGKPLKLGDEFRADVWLKTGDVSPEDIKVELVMARREGDEVTGLTAVRELKLISSESGIARYSATIKITMAGVFDFSFRVFPWKDFLPHRMDFPVVEWI
jgi:phosphorylase/glycogen(starch) synthase